MKFDNALNDVLYKYMILQRYKYIKCATHLVYVNHFLNPEKGCCCDASSLH